MALSWTKNISFLVLNVRANRLRRRGREKRRREGERRKKEEKKRRKSKGMEYYYGNLVGIYLLCDV